MTRQRNDSHSTEFGLWLRQQNDIDSGLGFTATNLDYLWQNYKTGEWMLIEEKRYLAKLSYSQSMVFPMIDRACHSDPKYKGFHVVVFERTSPEDGRMWIGGHEVTAQGMIRFLQFKGIEGVKK